MPEEEEPMEEPMPEEEDIPDDEDDMPPEAEDRPLEPSPVPLRVLPLPSVEPVPSVELPVLPVLPVVPELPEVGKGLELEAMVSLLCFRTLGVSAPADGRTWHAPMPAYTASGRPRGAR
jgi:hypothetical protein